MRFVTRKWFGVCFGELVHCSFGVFWILRRDEAIMTDVEWDKATDSIKDMVRNMRSDDASVVLSGIQAIRKLSQQDNPLIQELIDNGVVELCTEFLDSKE